MGREGDRREGGRNEGRVTFGYHNRAAYKDKQTKVRYV